MIHIQGSLGIPNNCRDVIYYLIAQFGASIVVNCYLIALAYL